MLMWITAFLAPTGALVLLYHLDTHYTLRGGASNTGFYCGAFYVDAADNFYGAYWTLGAALSFRLDTHYPIRGGDSRHGAFCGLFFVILGYGAGSTGWDTGAALSLYTLYLS